MSHGVLFSLRRFIEPGARVLEVGAGPGRFTIALAQLGAKVAVSDVSPVQLELNVDKVAEAGHAAAVESRHVLDVRDLSALPDESFDESFWPRAPRMRRRSDTTMWSSESHRTPSGGTLFSTGRKGSRRSLARSTVGRT
jgi:predicted RNA methylase